MSAFLDILLPPEVDLEWTSSAAFSTHVIQTASGKESRNQNWDGTLMRGVLRYNARKVAVWQEIDRMFQVCGGRAHSFKVLDPRHNVATTAEGKIASGQMVLRVTVGSYSIDKVITKPDATASLVGGGTFSTSTGAILSGSPSAWSGRYYLCCRFDVDQLEVTGLNRQRGYGLLAGFRDVPIVEVPDE